MRSTINAPVVGGKITADWGKGVARDQRANRLLPGVGYSVKHTPNGTSLIIHSHSGKEKIVESQPTGVFPWKVRWMSHSDKNPTIGEWQVYIPITALQVKYMHGDGSYVLFADIKNKKATNKDGKELVGWYMIEVSEDTAVETWNDDYGGGLMWGVVAEIDPWGGVEVTTSIRELETITDHEWQWLEPIATITEILYHNKDGETSDVIRKVNQEVSWSIEKQSDHTGAFAIVYEKGGENSKTAKIVNQSLLLGRQQVDKLASTEISNGVTGVWAKINHSSEYFSLEVLTSDPGESNDDMTCIKLYDLKNRVVLADYRYRLENLPFYTNGPDNGNSN